MKRISSQIHQYTVLAATSIVLVLASCAGQPKTPIQEKVEQIQTVPFEHGTPLTIRFERGVEYYHPLIVFWIEDTQGNYIKTLYASKSIATGVFRFGEHEGGKWKPGERRRPAALPYWGHRRGYQSPDGLYLPSPQNPLPDAITGATPQSSFVVNTFIPDTLVEFTLFMEINQTWDWNHYWHNNKFPGDDEYQTSAQPALVYSILINRNKPSLDFKLELVGHSHPSGSSGELFEDVSTFTTAVKIAKEVSVRVGE